MDFQALINHRHREIRDALKELSGAQKSRIPAQNKALIKFVHLLTVHATLIMEFVYPELECHDETEELAWCGNQEYHNIDVQIDDLARIDCCDPLWREKVFILRAIIEDHFRREKRVMLPALTGMLCAEHLDEISHAMRERTAILHKRLEDNAGNATQSLISRRNFIRGVLTT